MSIFGFRRKREASTPVADVASLLPATVLAAWPGAILIVDGEGTIVEVLGHWQTLFAAPVQGLGAHTTLGFADEASAARLQLWLANVVGHPLDAWPLHEDEAPVAGSAKLADGTKLTLGITAAPLPSDGVVARVVLFVRLDRQAEVALATAAAPLVGPSSAEVETFRIEASGLLSDCDAALTRLEADPVARHALQRLFRSLHTLKGTARTFGLGAVQDEAHRAETLLDQLRSLTTPVTPGSVAEVRAHLRTLGALVSAASAAPRATAMLPAASHDELGALMDGFAMLGATSRAIVAMGRETVRREAERLGLTLPARLLDEPNLASEIGTLVEELHDCPLPGLLGATLARELTTLQGQLARGEHAAAAVAAASMAAAGSALEVPAVAIVANGLAFALTDNANIADELEDVEVVTRLVCDLLPALPPARRTDILAMAQPEARRYVSAMQRTLEAWQANPRGDKLRHTLADLSQAAQLFMACARRFSMGGLEASAGELIALVDESLRLQRPPRSLAARIERWTADAETQLVLYHDYAVETRALGPDEAALALRAAAVAAADGVEARATALAAWTQEAAQRGVLCLEKAATEGTVEVAQRLYWLALDLPRFALSEGEPRMRPTATAALRALAAELDLAIAADPAAAPATRAAWPPLRRAIDNLDDVPLSSLVARLRRAAEDTAQALGREVMLRASCDGSAPANTVRKLGDVLLHAVRNAVDHGIDLPDARTAADKPRAGLIALVTTVARDRLRIELADDGRGIDGEAVRRRAVAAGLLSPAEAAACDDAALCELLFVPGFSTSEAVTVFSGRGVGLDVVRSEVEALGGRVALHSVSGQGCRLVIDIARGE